MLCTLRSWCNVVDVVVDETVLVHVVEVVLSLKLLLAMWPALHVTVIVVEAVVGDVAFARNQICLS